MNIERTRDQTPDQLAQIKRKIAVMCVDALGLRSSLEFELDRPEKEQNQGDITQIQERIKTIDRLNRNEIMALMDESQGGLSEEVLGVSVYKGLERLWLKKQWMNKYKNFVALIKQQMNSQTAWEQEYSERRLMTGDKPAKSFLKWVKWVAKRSPTLAPREVSLKSDFWSGKHVLDLGSGEGKNAFFLAGLGVRVKCIEIAQNAVQTNKKRVLDANLGNSVTVEQGSIGDPYNFPDNSFDLAIDVTSSNSLSESERAVYLSESVRVLRPGGHMFVRALCRDGDENAKYLVKNFPGPEHDTYVQPEWGLTERVFTESDIRNLYEQYFDIVKLEKETHYTKMSGKKFKRNFWVMYLAKKV